MSKHERILHFDCFSGIAGDMIVASLIDLGVPLKVIDEAVSKLHLSDFKTRIEKTQRSAIEATRFFVDVEEVKQPHRHWGDIKKMIEQAGIEPKVAQLAIKIFEQIAEAEAHAHGTTMEKVHFHEVGAVDSIVDIVGAAAAIVYLDARVTCSVVPLGNGMIRTAHGVLPVPAPATLFILKGVPVEGTEIQAELTTPTGAAIVKAAAQSFGQFPAMIPEAVGFGAGARSHETRPGLLRAVLGQATQKADVPSCFVIEANIDDMTGEVASQSATQLMETGALDVWFETIQMKKGRPALKLSILCKSQDLDRLAAQLFAQTSTIGLRYHQVGRMEMKRSMHSVQTPFGQIKVKVAYGPQGSANAAPEFEDCLLAAKEHGIPVKRVIAVASGIAQQLIE